MILAQHVSDEIHFFMVSDESEEYLRASPSYTNFVTVERTGDRYRVIC